jgi:hypothetical protein
MNKKDQLAIIQQHYPDAITTADTVNVLVNFVEESLHVEPAQVLLADSICSDDVNSIQYPIQNSAFLGPFKLGGLDGIPFTGLTGMGAFASHVPDKGAVFIYYGPHIGVPKEGALGEILRFGQHKNSGSCGAAKGALAKLTNDTITEGNVNDGTANSEKQRANFTSRDSPTGSHGSYLRDHRRTHPGISG